MGIASFGCWYGVQEYCRVHAWVYYRAPLDTRPAVVAIKRVFKNGKIRLTGPSGISFTADAGHLDRFSYQE